VYIELLLYNYISYGSVSSIAGRFSNRPPLLLFMIVLEFSFDVVFVVLVIVLLSLFWPVPFVWAIAYSKEVGLFPIIEINKKKENDKMLV